MKYTIFSHAQENTVQLQSVGHCLGTPAAELKAGDKLMWNFGYTSEIVEIVKESKSFIFVKELSGGNIYERRLKKDRLVVRLEK